MPNHDAVAIWIGFDPRPAETQGFAVARSSIRRFLTQPVKINGLHLAALRRAGLYNRVTVHRDGKMVDEISNAPMSTEFAVSRFLVPHLAREGRAVFVDADVMARGNIMQMINALDKSKACMVVKHNYKPKDKIKMDGQVQTDYERKNWSSVVLWNCDHPKTKMLTPDIVNKARGLWLHQFSWLDDNDIGELDPCWNHLVGEYDPNPDAKLVHFTTGTPNMEGKEGCEFAGEWWAELGRWAA